MDLTNPRANVRYQPCFISEGHLGNERGRPRLLLATTHIRAWHVNFDRYKNFMSPNGLAFMAGGDRLPAVRWSFVSKYARGPPISRHKLLRAGIGVIVGSDTQSTRVQSWFRGPDQHRLCR